MREISRARSVNLLACLVVVGISIPLVLRLIGPNRVYGFRTGKTLSSPDIWYPANAFAGWTLLIATGVSFMLFWFAPESWVARRWSSAAIILIPVFVAILISALYIGSL
jgi:uncharacterized membrane protein